MGRIIYFDLLGLLFVRFIILKYNKLKTLDLIMTCNNCYKEYIGETSSNEIIDYLNTEGIFCKKKKIHTHSMN